MRREAGEATPPGRRTIPTAALRDPGSRSMLVAAHPSGSDRRRRASAIRACPREDATTSHGGGSMPTSVRTAAPDITVNALCMFGDFSKFLLVSCRSGGHDRPGSLYDSYGFSPDAAIDPSTADSEDGSAWRHELDMTVDALTCMNRGVSYGYNRRDTRGRPA